MRHKIIFSTVLSAAMLFLAACTDNSRSWFLDAPDVGGSADFTPVELDALHVDGRYLKNEAGEIVNLHGFAQTFSPYFNKNAWSNYDVDGCLYYNKKCLDGVLAAGWKVNFVRQHMDSYWSSPDTPDEAHAYAYYDRERFVKYLNLVFIPMAEYAIERGCYVVMRPPGVSPETIAEGDKYNQYLIDVWDIVSSHPKVKNNPNIMFELANEPVNIVGTDGLTGLSTDSQFEALKRFLQPIVDKIRENGCNNILWLPGLGYQSLYSGCATHRVEGENLGYAVHCYCGWYGSDAEQDSGEGISTATGGGYQTFQQGWDKQVKPVADFAPIMVTEMDWAPAKYNSSWGKGITGTVGAEGFGANFKYLADNSSNVSWLLYTDQEYLMQFKDEAGTEGSYTFLNDPEACPWPVYHWFENYAAGDNVDRGTLTGLAVKDVADGELSLSPGAEKYLLAQATFSDGSTDWVTSKCTFVSSDPAVVQVENGCLSALCDGVADIVITYSYNDVEKQVTVHVVSSSFPPEEPDTPTPDPDPTPDEPTGDDYVFSLGDFNPSIWETGSFDTTTHKLLTGSCGFGGWSLENTGQSWDLSQYHYLVVELGEGSEYTKNGWSFRLFDNGYWGGQVEISMADNVKDNQLKIDLTQTWLTVDGRALDPTRVNIIGFWSFGDPDPLYIEKVYATNK